MQKESYSAHPKYLSKPIKHNPQTVKKNHMVKAKQSSNDRILTGKQYKTPTYNWCRIEIMTNHDKQS